MIARKKTRGERNGKTVSRSAPQKYTLRLFVSGSTAKSTQAVKNIKRICEEHLKGRYDLQVIDIYQQPELARIMQIVVVPTLIKQIPRPLKKLIGDMSNKEQVLFGLALNGPAL